MQLTFTKRIYPSFSIAAAVCTAAGISVQAQSTNTVPPSVLEQLKVETPSQPSMPGTISTATELQNLIPVAQTENELEREPSPSSYIGVGANLGIEGEETALREDNFAVIGKMGLTKNLSVHNATVIGDDTVSTFAVTYGIPIEDLGDELLDEAYIAPFVFAGGGAIFSLDEFDLQPLVTAGVDFPLAPDLSGTFRLNVGFLDDTEIGVLFGVGYKFSLFDLFD